MKYISIVSTWIQKYLKFFREIFFYCKVAKIYDVELFTEVGIFIYKMLEVQKTKRYKHVAH